MSAIKMVPSWSTGWGQQSLAKFTKWATGFFCKEFDRHKEPASLGLSRCCPKASSAYPELQLDVFAVPDVGFGDDVDGEAQDIEIGSMLPGPDVGRRRSQDPGRPAPSQGLRFMLRWQSSRLLMPVMPVILTGALLRTRCCHAGTSCGRHCP